MAQARLGYMSNKRQELLTLQRQELLTLREHLSSPPVFVAHIFSYLCCVVSSFVLIFFYCFACLPPVSCVLNVANVSGLSILGCPFSFR